MTDRAMMAFGLRRHLMKHHSTYVNDHVKCPNILFKIEPTEDGFLFVRTPVSGIKALSSETENSILDKVEALTDDMGGNSMNTV